MNIECAKQKARELVSQMTVEEKMSQLLYNSPAIERLGIHEHNWWNEASHGVARAGVATVFPHAIALAATFNKDLVGKVADAVSTEGRAKYNKSVEFGDRGIFKGLTYWTPNINIFRDPRWGRGQETFGEDPYLTSIMGVEFIRGLQGDGEFLKSAACAKHFAVHSGPEELRHTFNAEVSEKDLNETYLPAFEQAVKANVAGVMGAYNRTNGEPCCASRRLIQEILRGQWQFEGYFVSDCWAVVDIAVNHHYVDSKKDAAALALKNGCNLNCGDAYVHLIDAYEEDLITEEDITDAAIRLFTTRALLGEFEECRPFSDIPYDMLDCDKHKQLNLEVARQCLVMLKNEDEFLPIKKDKNKKIAVIGPTANSKTVLEGNYNGHASEYITISDGIRHVFNENKVYSANGSNIFFEDKNHCEGFGYLHSEGMAAASESDITILCLGLDRNIEGEETGLNNEYTCGGDRKTLYLPKTQIDLAESICDVCENVIVVVTCGSAIDLGEKVRNHAKAIIHAWYPGALGGLAVAQMLVGEFSPSGRLPLTFYFADKVLPEFTDYNMKGRTYRFVEEEPLYPFGYGLSYSTVVYDDFKIVAEDEEKITVCVKVTNTGNYALNEKIQVYASFDDSRTATPKYQLCGISSLYLHPNQCEEISVCVDKYWIKAVLEDGSRVTPNGKITLFAGSHQPDSLSTTLSGNACIELML